MQNACSAVIFRAYLSAVEKQGHLNALLERVRPQTKTLLQHPPLPISWVDYEDMNEVFRALGTVMSREQVRQLGLEAARDSVGPIIAPVLRGTLSIFGASPPGLFGNLRRVTGLVLKATDFTFVAESAHDGTIEILNPMPMDLMHYVGWEGAFLFGFEVLRVAGRVAPAQVLDGGRRGRVAISW